MDKEWAVSRWVVTTARLIVGGAIFVAIAINFANIIGRYILLAPIIWAEEILIFIMIWCVFIGSILVSWEGRHIKMDLLSEMMKGKVRLTNNTVIVVVTIAACIFVFMQSYTVTSLMNRLDQRSVVAEIPMTIPHIALALGFIGMLLATVFRIRSYVTGAFGSEIEAATTQVTEQFGIFEGAEQEAPDANKPGAAARKP